MMNDSTSDVLRSVSAGIVAAVLAAMLFGAVATPAAAQTTDSNLTDGDDLEDVAVEVTDTAMWSNDAKAVNVDYQAEEGVNVTVDVPGVEHQTLVSKGDGTVNVDVGTWVSGMSYPVIVNVTAGEETCSVSVTAPYTTVNTCNGQTSVDVDAPTTEVGVDTDGEETDVVVDAPFTHVDVSTGDEDCVTTVDAPFTDVDVCPNQDGVAVEVGDEALWNGAESLNMEVPGKDLDSSDVDVKVGNEHFDNVNMTDGFKELDVGSWFWGAGFPLGVSITDGETICDGVLTQDSGPTMLDCTNSTSN